VGKHKQENSPSSPLGLPHQLISAIAYQKKKKTGVESEVQQKEVFNLILSYQFTL
jgi:hypothetical protein